MNLTLSLLPGYFFLFIFLKWLLFLTDDLALDIKNPKNILEAEISSVQCVWRGKTEEKVFPFLIFITIFSKEVFEQDHKSL